jgi:hypothetical protein
MRFSRYLVVMAATWAIAAAAVGGFNLLVDPMGISPIRIAIAGFNERKPLRTDYDRIVKRHDVRRSQPVTIFMGSSRIKQTIDPKLVTNPPFAPAYNGAMNGSADYGEIGSYLRYYLEVDKKLRYVFIEAFATALLTIAAGPMTQFGLTDDIADFASVFFSVGGLNSAIQTVWLNRRNPRLATSSEDGFAPIALQPNHFSVRNVFNFMLHASVVSRSSRFDPRVAVAAKAMLADCQSHPVECHFFISPLHADALYAAYYLGLWPELEKLKRVLAELAPTYDFTRYNDIIEERAGPVVYWPEAFHFAPALGELMTKAMIGMRTAAMPANFGVVIDRHNIDASLAAWREERDHWITQHPDSVARMRKAEEDFQRGLSFKTVTDAEMAAGGW